MKKFLITNKCEKFVFMSKKISKNVIQGEKHQVKNRILLLVKFLFIKFFKTQLCTFYLHIHTKKKRLKLFYQVSLLCIIVARVCIEKKNGK